MRYTLEELEKKVKQIERFLGPRLNYSMNSWPRDKSLRWIMEYCLLLKERYYRRLKKSCRE